MLQYIPLHVHSHFSLLDGLPKISELVQRAKKLQMPALALTDHGVLYGAIEFYKACLATGIKPIIGEEFYLAPNGLHNKRPKVDEKPYHIVLLAKNEIGYKSLLQLTTIAQLQGFYYKPRIDLEILEKYKEGLIALTSCLQGEVPIMAKNYGLEKAKKTAVKYKEIFNEDFYLEVQHHPTIAEQTKVNEIFYKLGKELNIEVVATNDTHYSEKNDAEAQDILVCIQTKKHLQDKDRLSMLTENFSFPAPEEMNEWFKEHPEVLENTFKVAAKCNLKIKLGKIQLPHFPLPERTTPEGELKKLCEQGLRQRYNKITTENTERLNYELEIITKTGFASYFLIVQDFVNWAKKEGIVVGPGRGSAAGSIVAYLTGITNIDPIKYDLLFERFLNPERISMPDIDLDFSDTRRDEVISYVEKKYGQDHVAQIITFGTIAARAAIRDAGRVLGLSYGFCDKVAKLIPMFMSLDEALKVVPDVKDLYKKDADAHRLLDSARKIEGVARHASRHACGIVITKDELTEHVPLQFASQDDKTIVSQYELHAIEDLGLLKMDFLGLKNLTIIENTIKILEKTTGEKIDIDQIPMNDKKTFTLLQHGRTTGVFQLESSGMKRYLRELKPTVFEDIIAMVALYRPGPMEWIPQYIAGKHNKAKLDYLHPKLEPILHKTYGVAIYQEQLMRIVRDLAGFTLAEADVLRKAVGKKISRLLKQQKEKFIAGCLKNKISQRIAEQIFDFIEPFAGYGFNRAHSACYALIAYETAFLKANYPVQFMAALLTSDYGDSDRIAIEVNECRELGIEILPPNINESFSTFTVVKESLKDKPRIRFGLTAIKNLGSTITRVIIDERKANEPYKNLEDFLRRVQHKDLNKKSLESLIKTGALDEFGERNEMLLNIENLLNYIKLVSQERSSGQRNLFAELPVAHLPQLKLQHFPPATSRQRLSWEKELLGLYISSHPLAEFAGSLKHIAPLASLQKKSSKLIRVIGVITKIQRVLTRSGEPMLFITLEDVTGKVEVIVFPRLKEELQHLWQEEKIIVCEGQLSDKEGEPKILLNRAWEFNPEQKKAIIIVPTKIKRKILDKLKEIIETNEGNLNIYLDVNGKEIDTHLKTNESALEEIRVLFGTNAIKVL